MLNFKKKKVQEKKPKLVVYKDYPPAQVIDAERRGKHLYLFLRWGNYHINPKWVKASLCSLYEAPGKRVSFNPFGRAKLNWFEKLIVRLQNLWYGKD